MQRRFGDPVEQEILPSRASDVDSMELFSGKNLSILYIVLGLVVLYIIGRAVFSSSASGIASFQPEYCYTILGYTTDPYLIQSRCWAELAAQQQKVTLPKASFAYWTPSAKTDFTKRLKELKQEFPEMRRHWGSPIIFEGCQGEESIYVGGFNEFISRLQQRHKVQSSGECVSFF